MHDWPRQSAGVIPSPELVAAWLVLDVLPAERVPGWAAHWLAAGYDGHALAELGGLHGDDPREVRDLLDAALAECGVTIGRAGASAAGRERAAAMVAFTVIASLQIDGLLSERWVVDKVFEITEPYNPEWITSLPLGQLFILADEWGAGWGRTEDRLRAGSDRPVSSRYGPPGSERCMVSYRRANPTLLRCVMRPTLIRRRPLSAAWL